MWSHFQKRSLFLNNKIETVADISIGEDAIMMTQLILATDRIVSLNIPTVNYYRNSSSMSCLPNEESIRISGLINDGLRNMCLPKVCRNNWERRLPICIFRLHIRVFTGNNTGML